MTVSAPRRSAGNGRSPFTQKTDGRDHVGRPPGAEYCHRWCGLSALLRCGKNSFGHAASGLHVSLDRIKFRKSQWISTGNVLCARDTLAHINMIDHCFHYLAAEPWIMTRYPAAAFRFFLSFFLPPFSCLLPPSVPACRIRRTNLWTVPHNLPRIKSLYLIQIKPPESPRCTPPTFFKPVTSAASRVFFCSRFPLYSSLGPAHPDPDIPHSSGSVR